MIVWQKLLFREHLDDGEKLFEVVHKHPIEIFPHLFLTLFIGVVIPLFIFLKGTLILPWYVYTICILFAGMYFFYHFIDWYCDAWLLTNYSILHVEWMGVFERSSSRIEYDDIREVNYTKNGIMATSLDFGILSILSVSGGEYTFKNINKPKKIEMMIRDYRNRFSQSQRFMDAQTLDQILGEMIRKHVYDHGLPR